MLVSDKYKYFFIHIPKTGGTSLKRALLKATEGTNVGHRNIGHRKATDVSLSNPEKWKKYFTFTVVRNPWDWEVSAYHFICVRTNHRDHKAVKGKSFEEYIDMRHNNLLPELNYNQANWVCDENDNLLIDAFYYFHRLADAFTVLCKRLGLPATELPHLNRTRHKPYWEYYNPEMKRRVAALHHKDIKLFDFKFRSE